MTQVILDHGVSGCFGTRVAPSKGFSASFNGGSEGGQLSTQGTRPSRRCSIVPSIAHLGKNDADGCGLSCPGSSVVADE